MKKLMSIFFVVFNVINAFGQNLLHITNSTNVDFSLRRQSVINGEIRGTAYSNSGSIFLFFRVELLSKNDTVTVNASVKKVMLESTISNQTRIYSSEKQEGLTSEMTAYIKKILESPISMDISAINGEVISVDTSKAVRFLTNVKWENFFDDFASSLFNFTTVKAHRKRALISKIKEGISEKIHYLLDSAAGGNNYFSFSGTRKINDKLVDKLMEIIKEVEPIYIVVGNPKHLSGDESAKSSDAIEFANLIKDIFNGPIYFVDERLTTANSYSQMREIGKSEKDSKHIIDQIAAINILESAILNERSGTSIGRLL
jgi:putative Holliday junction resolvase